VLPLLSFGSFPHLRCNYLTPLGDLTTFGTSRNLLQRFRPSVLPLRILRNKEVSLYETRLLARQPAMLSSDFQSTTSLHLAFREFKGLFLPSFFPQLPQSLRKRDLCARTCNSGLKPFTAQTSSALLQKYHEGSIPPELSHSDSFRGTCTCSSQQIVQQLSSVESLRLCATPAVAVFDSLCPDSQLRLLLQPAHSLHSFNNPFPLLDE
jgi:hypothetical protein